METPGSSLRPAVVNDQQSRLNRVAVAHRVEVTTERDILDTLALAERRRWAVAVCGGRHAMGGQQFAAGGVLLDLSGFNRVLDFDAKRGLVTCEAGIFWPDLMRRLDELQPDEPSPWVIRQKQTGVDRVSVGGSLAANAHGRGLRMAPMVADCESLTVMDALGTVHTCSRAENPELFSLVIGGYGCLGMMLTATLRLTRRQTVQRRVRAIEVADLIDDAAAQIEAGALYGDCQFATHLQGPAADHRGIFSCYHPVAGPPDPPDEDLRLSAEQWTALIRLARTDKVAAFELYRDHYLKTDGRRYASDRHQLSPVFESYLAAGRASPAHGAQPQATEMITEVYVAPEELMNLLTDCRADFRAHGVDVSYGTIRLIEPDTETFLPWATRRWACVVVNLRVVHRPAEIAKARRDFRRILDRVIERGGSFYLTYHRWAERRHLDAAYPNLADFLRRKLEVDPHERFASDWYRHLKSLYPEVHP